MRHLILTISLALAACAVGPDYVEPQTEPAEFINDVVNLTNEPFEAAWWRQLGDPTLDQLVGRALSEDLDVQIAAARVREARALFRDVQLDQLPTVTAGAVYDERKAQQPGFTDQRIEADSYELGFDASWELDVFGRVRRSVEAARAIAGAAEARLRDAQVTVAAEVARNYLELRGAQRRLAVAQANLENQRETVRLTRVRYELGRGNELDLASARARQAATQATIPPLVAAEQAAAHRLAVLLGQRPGSLDSELAPREIEPHLQPLPIGAAEDLLRRRPDVRSAERRLAAATAREGVAAADLFPRVTLTGFLGFIAGRGSLFGEADSRAWAVTPALSWAAFDLGSARARLRGAEAATRESLAEYEQTVLLALEETENALVNYRHEQQRLVKLVDQVRESTRAADIARIRYREGVADFLSLLDAERTQLQAEDAVAQAEVGVFTSVVAVYKALGGIVADPSARGGAGTTTASNATTNTTAAASSASRPTAEQPFWGHSPRARAAFGEAEEQKRPVHVESKTPCHA